MNQPKKIKQIITLEEDFGDSQMNSFKVISASYIFSMDDIKKIEELFRIKYDPQIHDIDFLLVDDEIIDID